MPDRILSIVVPGNPISKSNAAKVRWNRALHRSEMYYPAEFIAYEELIKVAAIEYLAANPELKGFMSGPVHIQLDYYCEARHRKDLLNLPKTTCDALNGNLYTDDCQIVSSVLNKYYDKKNPRVEIFLSRPENWQAKIALGVWSLPEAYATEALIPISTPKKEVKPRKKTTKKAVSDKPKPTSRKHTGFKKVKSRAAKRR